MERDDPRRRNVLLLGVGSDGRLITHDRPTGIITVGTTGAGKFLTAIALNLFNWMLGSCWVFDPKGEITAVTAQFRAKFSKVIVINPFRVLYSTALERGLYPFMRHCGFNLLEMLEDAGDEFEDRAASLVARLIYSDNSRDDYWLQGARSVLIAVLVYLYYGKTAVDADGVRFPFTLSGVQAFLRQSPEELTAHARMVLTDKRECMHLAHEGMAEWAHALGATPKPDAKKSPRAQEWPKSTLETLSTLRRQLDELLRARGVRATFDGTDFSWRELREKNVTVYVVIPANKVEDFERFTALLFDSALEAFSVPPKPGDKPIYMVLDEVATALARRMEWIGRAYAIARAQRIIIHSFFQNYSQVLEAFKHPGKIMSAAGSQVFYRNEDEPTIELLRRRGGTRTQWVRSVTQNWGTQHAGPGQKAQRTSDGGSASWQASARDLIEPPLVQQGLRVPDEQNGYLGDQIILREGLAAPVLAERGAYWQLDEAWALYHNPYAPQGRFNPPPPVVAPQPAREPDVQVQDPMLPSVAPSWFDDLPQPP